MRKVRKAVFPVAGLGTRLLPATKSIPKEMLTIVDRPVIQYVVDEARAAGIEHFIFVTGRNKQAIEDHFDHCFELEAALQQRKNAAALRATSDSKLPAGRSSFTRQQMPLGLGHAVWCARDLVGDEPFAVLLPDMVMKASPSCLAQMVKVFDSNPDGNVIAVEEVPEDETHNYGVVAGPRISDNQLVIESMVEKPPRGTAQSNLIISGRYIFQPELFDILEQQAPGAGGEIQLTDAMLTLMQHQTFHGLKYEGQTFDCGNKYGFVAANIAMAMEDQTLARDLERVITEVVKHRGGSIEWRSNTKAGGIAIQPRSAKWLVPAVSEELCAALARRAG